MRQVFGDAALRRGIYDGLIIAAVLTVLVVLTNVVFPPDPAESDSDPEYVAQIGAVYLVMALLLVVIGARARRRSDGFWSGAKGGAAAGLVLAIAVTLIFLIVNNLFLDLVSQQHDKRVAFAASGWSSMRAYVSVQQLVGALFLIPAGTIVGAGLGLLGGAVFRPRGHGTPAVQP